MIIQDWRIMFVCQAEEMRRDYLVLSNQLSLVATLDPPLMIIQDWRIMFVCQAEETRRDYLVLSNQLSLATTLLSIHVFPSQVFEREDRGGDDIEMAINHYSY